MGLSGVRRRPCCIFIFTVDAQFCVVLLAKDFEKSFGEHRKRELKSRVSVSNNIVMNWGLNWGRWRIALSECLINLKWITNRKKSKTEYSWVVMSNEYTTEISQMIWKMLASLLLFLPSAYNRCSLSRCSSLPTSENFNIQRIRWAEFQQSYEQSIHCCCVDYVLAIQTFPKKISDEILYEQ